jgi:hypothetical protein
MTGAADDPAVHRRRFKQVNTMTRRNVGGAGLYDSLEANCIEAEVNFSG